MDIKSYRLGRAIVTTIAKFNPSIVAMRASDFNRAYGHMFVNCDVPPSMHLYKYKKLVMSGELTEEQFILGKKLASND